MKATIRKKHVSLDLTDKDLRELEKLLREVQFDRVHKPIKWALEQPSTLAFYQRLAGLVDGVLRWEEQAGSISMDDAAQLSEHYRTTRASAHDGVGKVRMKGGLAFHRVAEWRKVKVIDE